MNLFKDQAAKVRNLLKDQAVKVHRTKTALAGMFVIAMIFGAVCMTLDMMDQAAVRGSVRICQKK